MRRQTRNRLLWFLIKRKTHFLKKMHSSMSSSYWWSFCSGLCVLIREPEHLTPPVTWPWIERNLLSKSCRISRNMIDCNVLMRLWPLTDMLYAFLKQTLNKIWYNDMISCDVAKGIPGASFIGARPYLQVLISFSAVESCFVTRNCITVRKISNERSTYVVFVVNIE